VDANVFKIRAFQNGARVLESQSENLRSLIKSGELEKLKGIGKGISSIVHDLWDHGVSEEHQELRSQFPETLFNLFKIPGLGAKRIKVLYQELEVKSLGELEYACHENRLLDLDGFGVKMQEKILKGIEHCKKFSGHYLLSFADQTAQRVVGAIKKVKGLKQVQIAGSLRRSKEIVKDISGILGLNYNDAVFGTVNEVYKKKYGKTLDEMSDKILKRFVFEMPNPFL